VAVGVGVNVAVAVAVGVNVAVAVAVAVGVDVGVGLAIVKVTGWVLVPQLLVVTLRVTLYVPAVVGVPEIKPVDVLTVRPGGNPLAP
jgi:hypothetical protein